MQLYHFTDPSRLESIKKYGIAKGDVPISINGGYNAPWFTSDPNPHNQGWTVGGTKNHLRLTVDFSDGDENLVKWTDIIEQELSKIHDEKEKEFRKLWYDSLNEVAGGGHNNWYIYHGVVPKEWIKKVDFF